VSVNSPGNPWKEIRGQFILGPSARARAVSVDQNADPGKRPRSSCAGANSEHTLVLLEPASALTIRSHSFSVRARPRSYLFDNIRPGRDPPGGPQSPLYGSDALAGVVNIITKRGPGSARWTMGPERRILRHVLRPGRVSGSSDRVDYSLGASGFTTGRYFRRLDPEGGEFGKDVTGTCPCRGGSGSRLRKESPRFRRWSAGRSTPGRISIISAAPTVTTPNNRQDLQVAFPRPSFGPSLREPLEQKLALPSRIPAGRMTTLSTTSIAGIGDRRLPGEADIARLAEQFSSSTLEHRDRGPRAQQERGESEYNYAYSGMDFPSPFPLQKASAAGCTFRIHSRLAAGLRPTAGVRLRHSQARRGDGASPTRSPRPFVISGTGHPSAGQPGPRFQGAVLLFSSMREHDLRSHRNRASSRRRSGAGRRRRQTGETTFVRGLPLTYFHQRIRDLIDFSFSEGYVTSPGRCPGASRRRSTSPAPKISP